MRRRHALGLCKVGSAGLVCAGGKSPTRRTSKRVQAAPSAAHAAHTKLALPVRSAPPPDEENERARSWQTDKPRSSHALASTSGSAVAASSDGAGGAARLVGGVPMPSSARSRATSTGGSDATESQRSDQPAPRHALPTRLRTLAAHAQDLRGSDRRAAWAVHRRSQLQQPDSARASVVSAGSTALDRHWLTRTARWPRAWPAAATQASERRCGPLHVAWCSAFRGVRGSGVGL